MREGVHRLLVHEIPGCRKGDSERRDACSFEDLFDEDSTPLHLLKAGLYDEIAMNLGGDEWRAVGLIKIIEELKKGVKDRDHYRAEPEDAPYDSYGRAWVDPENEETFANRVRLESLTRRIQ